MKQITITHKDFKDEDIATASLLMELYEGEHECVLKKMLDGKYKGGLGKRHDWKERGIIPAFRNIIKPIVQKSGRLFNRPPSLEIYDSNNVLVENTSLSDILYKADWIEFYQNVDNLTRLFGSTSVLYQQYIPQPVLTRNGIYQFNASNGEKLIQTLLHPGNSVGRKDIAGNITEIAYITDDEFGEDEAEWSYRYINEDVIIDYWVKGDEQFIHSQADNLNKMVPLVIFYDTSIPTDPTEFYSELPLDLLNFQMLYNLALTDTHFAMAWAKSQTLFVNAEIVSNEATDIIPAVSYTKYSGQELYSDVAEAASTSTSTNLGGLGSVVRLKNDEQGNPPLVEFKGPSPDLTSLHDILTSLVKDIALDWCVNLRYEGSGSANSGFQIIVEEMDNLSLRETRGYYFQAAFNRMYNVLQKLYPELSDGQLVIKWAPPSLPVNKKEQEDLWSVKITQNRASVIDYFMELDNLTEDEALRKAEKVLKYNALFAPSINSDTTTNPADGSQQK